MARYRVGRLWLGITLLIICQALPGACVHAGDEQLVVEGSTTLLPLTERLARDFERQHRGAGIAVKGGGSAVGIAALIEGRANIASSSRFINTEELASASARQVYPVPFRIADDCVIPIIHKSNRIRSLSLADLGKVYRGEIDNWQQLGGEDRAIVIVSRDTSSGTFATWHRIVVGEREIAGSALVRQSTRDVVELVSRNRGAIGYIGLGSLSANIKPVSVNGVMGSLRTLRDGSYAISRSLFLFTDGWPSGMTQEFINYVMDPVRGQRQVEHAGFVPLYSGKSH